MRNPSCVLLFVLTFSLVGTAAQRGGETPTAGADVIGRWSGTWEGMGSSGGFDFTIAKGASDIPVTGKVSVTGDPAYDAVLKTITFEGKKLLAKYDFPPNDAAEVALTLFLDGNSVKGTWSLRAKANNAEAANGTVTLTRK